MSFFQLRRSRKLLKKGVALYSKKSKKLSEHQKNRFETLLQDLDEAILKRNTHDAKRLTKDLDAFVKAHFKKTTWDHLQEFIFALAFAIVIAFAIRQLWFELYEVPTGSMRPTIGELDRLVVSKTTFGINLPFQKNLLLFSPDYLKRAGIIVFTVEDMDVADADTTYFYLFPGKKRYIKRCMGKPGDTLYFYGGRLYGIDKEGKPIEELSDESYLKKIGIEKIDHVPYISFEGKQSLSSPLAQGIYGSATLFQMNEPRGKLQLKKDGTIQGQFFNGKEWVKDHPESLKISHNAPESYSDLWGIRNFAMARLLTKKEVEQFYHANVEEGVLYLELHHTPNLSYPLPEMRRGEMGRIQPMITPFTTLIPLQQSHLEILFSNLYTSRFFIQNGHAYRYNEGNKRLQPPEFDPLFPEVPNGCYEFYYGKGYKVLWGGIKTALPKDHPLYSQSPETIQKLFNLGIGFNLVYQPIAAFQPYTPQRFAYFRNGDLYVMGAPLLKKTDPVLEAFVKRELEKQESSSLDQPYIAFIDRGPPLLESGELDIEFIKAFGLKIPENGVFALGDNYAMSADSRDFGFVPTMNLRGAPSFTFWPPSNRLGALPQPSYPWLTLPNCLIWGTVIAILIILTILFKVQSKKPIFKKK